LLNAVKGDPIEPAVYLGLFLGLRRSEVVGLRWKDIDFDKKLITIQNTVVRFSTISELEKTKSRASRRTLFMPDTLKEYLEALKASQEEARAVIGRKYSEEEHVLQWPDGTSYNPSYVTHRFKKVLKANRLPEIRFHDLRHTAGSILLNDGLSIKQIQNMLGHEKSSTTLDIYSHLSTTGKHETAQAMNRLLS
jgi:integrase